MLQRTVHNVLLYFPKYTDVTVSRNIPRSDPASLTTWQKTDKCWGIWQQATGLTNICEYGSFTSKPLLPIISLGIACIKGFKVQLHVPSSWHPLIFIHPVLLFYGKPKASNLSERYMYKLYLFCDLAGQILDKQVVGMLFYGPMYHYGLPLEE